MKTRIPVLITLGLILALCPPAGHAVTTIDLTDRNAYAGNIGWIDWVADTNNGAVLGDYVCSGYIYSGNAGWINLGSGNPANGIQYQNNAAGDFGINQDGLGNLSGDAWGANIGWITFEQTYGKPNINLLTGALSGYAWSANCGWICLSNMTALVKTDSLYPGPLSTNGLPIPWLLANLGTTNISANADPTGKGMTIGQDYLAGTNPNNPASLLYITAESFALGGSSASLTWESVPTRVYSIYENTNLTTSTWTNSNAGLIAPSSGATTTASFTDTQAPRRFYRVQAELPLSQ